MGSHKKELWNFWHFLKLRNCYSKNKLSLSSESFSSSMMYNQLVDCCIGSHLHFMIDSVCLIEVRRVLLLIYTCQCQCINDYHEKSDPCIKYPSFYGANKIGKYNIKKLPTTGQMFMSLFHTLNYSLCLLYLLAEVGRPMAGLCQLAPVEG